MRKQINTKPLNRSRPVKGKTVPKKRPISVSRKRVVKRQIRQNRPIHKRILLNPISIFIFLCALVFVANWTYKASADTTISAEVSAPALTRGAVITSPTNGAVFIANKTIAVSGTCPDYSYVEILNNGGFSGVALCSSNLTFQIQISLFDGENDLVAKDYNTTNQQGPATDGIIVNLKESGDVNTANQSTDNVAASTTASPPLVLTSAFVWETFNANSTFSWKMDVAGGDPPYTVKVNWGDGRASSYRFNTDPVFNITHTYTQPGYYAIKAYSVDAKGHQQVIQLAALINPIGKTGNFFASPTTPSSNATKTGGLTSFLIGSKAWLWVAWPSLIVVALMMFSFWLGELQDKRRII